MHVVPSKWAGTLEGVKKVARRSLTRRCMMGDRNGKFVQRQQHAAAKMKNDRRKAVQTRAESQHHDSSASCLRVQPITFLSCVQYRTRGCIICRRESRRRRRCWRRHSTAVMSGQQLRSDARACNVREIRAENFLLSSRHSRHSPGRVNWTGKLPVQLL